MHGGSDRPTESTCSPSSHRTKFKPTPHAEPTYFGLAQTTPAAYTSPTYVTRIWIGGIQQRANILLRQWLHVRDGGRLSRHNDSYISRDDMYVVYEDRRSAIKGEICTAYGGCSGDSEGYTAYPHCQGRTSFETNTRDSRRQTVYPLGDFARDGTSHGTNDLPSFPLDPPPALQCNNVRSKSV